MEFIKDNHGDSIQKRIILKSPQQHTFGYHQNPRVAADRFVETNSVADCLSDTFVALKRHSPSSRASCNAARFQHHDLPVLFRQRPQDLWRHASRLACTCRSPQYDGI